MEEEHLCVSPVESSSRAAGDCVWHALPRALKKGMKVAREHVTHLIFVKQAGQFLRLLWG